MRRPPARDATAASQPICPSPLPASHPLPQQSPPSKEELASRTPQVVKCNEALREVTLSQTVQGKQFGRTYHFDKARDGEQAGR